jgi:hypothetical protein
VRDAHPPGAHALRSLARRALRTGSCATARAPRRFLRA